MKRVLSGVLVVMFLSWLAPDATAEPGHSEAGHWWSDPITLWYIPMY